MDDKRWKRLQELFKSAVDMDQAAQAAFVDAHCGDDAEMRDQLHSLLSHDASTGFSVHGAIQQAAGESPFAKEASDPTQIGPYLILRRVGRGGMGEVFEAEQTHPVQRRVALKRIRTGMNSAHVLARFEIERQILARMTTPRSPGSSTLAPPKMKSRTS